MNLTGQETTEDGDPLLFSMELGEEALDEILLDNSIVPCHLHRNLATTRFKHNALSWLRAEVESLATEMKKNN